MGSEGASALDRLDEILAQQPKPEQQLYSQCLSCLTAMRDQMIGSGTDRTTLAYANAVISVVMAGHFPLGPVPWDELLKARGWLARIVERSSPCEPSPAGRGFLAG